MRRRVWLLGPDRDEAATAAQVAAVLADDGVVALPTETYYGLAARCRSPRALRRVARLKRRPATMPLLLLVDGPDRASALTTRLSPLGRSLMERFWPGPLTLVLPAVAGLGPELLGRDGTVAVRHPSHSFPCAVVTALGEAITGTSANLSGADPPRLPADVVLAPEEHLDGLVDGGMTAGGAPSTLLRVDGDRARLLRPGAVSEAALREALGDRLV